MTCECGKAAVVLDGPRKYCAGCYLMDMKIKANRQGRREEDSTQAASPAAETQAS